MAREKQRNTPHILTTPLHTRAPHVLPEDQEFFESDVVWSDYNIINNNNNDDFYVNTLSTTPPTSSPRGFTAGISAALLSDNQPRIPTSIQRKMTSSPVSMISSSYLARNNSGSGNGGGGSGPSSRFHMSAPVNVPIWPNKNKPKFEDEDEDEDEDNKMVPPHEIVARSCSKTAAFSVVEGAGRTLKGRDLTKVRNAVFHKTGFLD